MGKYRNITSDTLWVDIDGTLVRVDPDTVVELPASRYVQTGDQGEPPLFAVVSDSTKKGGK